jgi:hypothetical protein
MENLREEDPDVVVDLLDITTAELLAKFPKKVSEYLDGESNLDTEEEE